MRLARPLSLRFANFLLAAGNASVARRFQADVLDPEAAQARTLARILAANRESAYGRAHGFGQIDTAREFQAALPMVSYDELAPWIARAVDGEAGVLTTEPILAFEKSSGSTAAAKYLPFTASLKREFWAGTAVWLADLLAQRPALRGLGAYWSVSPIARQREVTPGGIPVGFEEDTQYFGAVERWVLGQIVLTPPGLARVEDLEAIRYVTLRHLLDHELLGLVSVWNPSFLTLLVEAAEREGDRLVADLRAGTLSAPGLTPAQARQFSRGLVARPGRAGAIAQRLRAGEPLTGRDLFPQLALISSWGDAAAAHGLQELLRRFPGVEHQPKGLLATEGIVTFPLLGHPGGVLSLQSHFYEFLPPDGGTPLLAHELEPGRRYEVLLTTGGGLYRYRLYDVVEVVGAVGRTPLLRFIGKGNLVSDQVGEKLNEQHVAGVVAEAMGGVAAPFALLAPEHGPTRYVLYLEAAEAPEGLAARVEAGLRANPHYAYARDLGQLAPVATRVLSPDAQARFLAGCQALGQRAGDVKPGYLRRETGWGARLGAE